VREDIYPDSDLLDADGSTSVDRRDFFRLVGGGITVFFTAGLPLAGAQRRGQQYPDDFNAYLRIGEDGRVSCFSGKIEMGQGIITSLAQMLAEELEVPLALVDMVMGDTALCPYDGATVGSRSTKYFGPALRRAAAEAKGVLIQLAAERMDVPEDRLVAKNGIITDKNNSGRKVSYAQLARGQRIARHMQGEVPIKHHSSHTVSGKATPRTDSSQKVTGEAKFAGDIRLPGLLHAKILRPPAHGAKLRKVDVSGARQIEGSRVVQKEDLVAVLHEHPDEAERGLDKIKAEWDEPELVLNNRTIFEHLTASAQTSNVVTEKGNLAEGNGQAAQSFAHTYLNHYVAHAPMEPHTAVVHIGQDGTRVWASTQAPFRVRDSIARLLDLSSEKVRVFTPFVGGGFGGKTASRQVTEAARLAKITGRPVQVAWTRKEEFLYDTFRPAAVIKMKSGIDRAGRILFWDYDNYFAGSRSSEPVYDIPHQRVLSRGAERGTRVHPFGTGAWRGPGSNTNVFAMESQIDIMAAAAGTDPLSFRLKNLKESRMRRVLEAAGKKFGKSFVKAPSGKGFGIACTNYLGTCLATMAEVRADVENGRVQVERIVCAQDLGEIINPEGVRLQLEGCITMGLGYVLSEEIQFQGGKILDENFNTYEITRFSWTPRIETVLIDNPGMAPQGCGEPAITSMGGVIANAVYDAIGVRMFELPMTPERIMAGKERSEG